MKITTQALAGQYRRALAAWPFIPDVEGAHGLPALLLFAVGSRETNLTNEIGDAGHGYGPWQLDNRSHTIPADLMTDTLDAAHIAAAILKGNLDYFHGDLTPALCAYNAGAGRVEKAVAAGRDPNLVTTGSDYAADILVRLAFLQSIAAPPAPVPAPFPWELDLQIAPNAVVDFLPAAAGGCPGLSAGAGWELHADGGIDQATPDTPFWGGYWDLPATAHENQPARVFLAVTPRRDTQPGYEIRATDLAYYTFGPGLNGFAA